jgi:hypothetical protein
MIAFQPAPLAPRLPDRWGLATRIYVRMACGLQGARLLALDSRAAPIYEAGWPAGTTIAASVCGPRYLSSKRSA